MDGWLFFGWQWLSCHVSPPVLPHRILLRHFDSFPAPHSTVALGLAAGGGDGLRDSELAFSSLRAMQLEPGLRTKWATVSAHSMALLQHQVRVRVGQTSVGSFRPLLWGGYLTLSHIPLLTHFESPIRIRTYDGLVSR